MSNDMIFLALRLVNTVSLDSIDTFIDFLDVLVDSNGVLGLTNDLEQILIGKEEESGEEASLGGQQIVQLLLHDFKLVVQLVKLLDKADSVLNESSVCIPVFVDARHFIAESVVNLLEDGVLLGKLLLNVLLATKDGFEILPSVLDSDQDLKSIRDLGNVVLPSID